MTAKEMQDYWRRIDQRHEGPTHPRDPNDLHTWGGECARGFVSCERFGSGQVIERTNRSKSREWRKMEAK